MSPVTRPSSWSTGRAWLGLILFALLTRLPALLQPKAIDDEQVYSVVGIEMLHGGRPYLDAIERKPPLLFLLYQGIFTLAGAYNWIALHATAMLWTLTTMAVLFLIVRRLFDPRTGLIAALLYGLFLSWGDYRNLALNGELLMNLPVAMAVALTLGPPRSRFRPELFLAGALVATGFLLKQPSGIAGLPLGLYLLHPGYRRRHQYRWPTVILQGAVLSLGFLTLLAGIGVALWREGILREAIYWTVLSQEAAFGVRSGTFWDRAISDSAFFLISTLPLVLLALLSLRERSKPDGIWREREPEWMALTLLLAVSVVGVGVNGQFLYHYYLQLILPLALLAAPSAAAIWTRRRTVRWLTPRLLTGWLACSALVFLVVNTIGLRQHSRPMESAQWVGEHSDSTDRIFVWGQGTRQTGMYLDARRRPASRYIASFPLTGHIFGSAVSWDPAFDTSDRIVPGAWENLAADFERHPPRYIIDTDAVRATPVYRIAKYPFLRGYLAANYREVYRAADGIVYGRRPAD